MIETLDLSKDQAERLQDIRSFVALQLAPHATTFDRERCLPRSFLDQLFGKGYFCAALPAKWGGGGWDMPSYGLLHAEIGGELASAAAIITVHDMVAHALLHWGTADQKRRWLPDLASGRHHGCFAVTEETAGSDVRGVQMSAVRQGSSYILNGVKKWITGGRLGTLFVVLATVAGKLTAFVVDGSARGLSTHAGQEMLGFRAAMLADVHFDNCAVPEVNVLGRVNFGVEGPVQSALDLGRYAVACSCSGLAAACLNAAVAHATTRMQFGALLHQHQLVARMLTDMATDVQAAKLLCWRAGCDRDSDRSSATLSTLMAKYFNSRAAATAATNTVQIMGARGCGEYSPAARYLRDSKIMEIIEGSTEIQQIVISKLACNEIANGASNHARAGAGGGCARWGCVRCRVLFRRRRLVLVLGSRSRETEWWFARPSS